MRLRILGPVEVWDGRVWIPVRAGKQRELLTILVLHHGMVVDRDWLIDTLWQGAAPPSAVRLLPHYVWRLRTLLPGCAGLLHTAPSGYLLEMNAVDLDSQRFTDLVAEGRTAADHGDQNKAIDRYAAGLGLWRGPALADTRSLPLLDAAAQRLDQTRVEARETLADLQLASGRHIEALPALEELTAAEPYREHPWRLLMLALSRAGRRPEAVATYQRLWRIWTDQLGIEPGQDLRELHHRLLTDDLSPARPPPTPGHGAAGGPVPRQLPSTARHFVGRTDELNWLTRLLDQPAGPGGTVVICAIAGTAGVGKTALAIYWAHRVAPRFPDGQLYVNLRGFDPFSPPTAPSQAVRRFLVALDVLPHRIPGDTEAQVALYRSLLAGRRMLILLDNARDAAQIRPLLPGAPGCMTVITSRDQLIGLVAAEGAHPLTVDLMSTVEARQLLAGRLGDHRIAAEPAAVDKLIDLCARLPLALAIAAARAAGRIDQTITELATELRSTNDRLDAFDTRDIDTDIRTVFSWSYRLLSPPAAHLFRLLGLHPGPDLGAPAAASIAGVPIDAARPMLAELIHANLLSTPTPGRYNLHDLLRAYAAEQSNAIDAHDQRQAAGHRMLDHYLHTAYTADRLLNPVRDPITLAPPQPGVTPEHHPDHAHALTWFTAEHPVLIAAIQHATNHARHQYAWQLAWTMTNFLNRQGHWHDWASTERAGLAAAQQLGDIEAETRAHRFLASAHTLLGNYHDADTHLQHALDLCTLAGDRVGQAHTHHGLARLRDLQGRQPDALHHAQQALALHRATGHHIGQANALGTVGWYLAVLGHYDQALEHSRQSLAMHQALGNHHGQAATWDTIAYIHHHLGHYTDAITSYARALDLYRERGDRYGEAGTLARLGDTHDAAGHTQAARAAWQQALTILDELGHVDAEKVRDKILTSVDRVT